jgi:hypothetical protein
MEINTNNAASLKQTYRVPNGVAIDFIPSEFCGENLEFFCPMNSFWSSLSFGWAKTIFFHPRVLSDGGFIVGMYK